MQNLLKQIEELRMRIVRTSELLEIDKRRSWAEGLKREMSRPDFWSDQAEAVRTSKEAEEIEKEVVEWDSLAMRVRELEEFVALADREAGEDGTIEEDAAREYGRLKAEFERLEFYVLMSGKYDRSGAILSVHAGTGGVDAQDWAEILERMFLRYAEKKRWRAEIFDRTAGAEAGLKSASMRISGAWAYGHLKSENGVHRLVRISPFDAEAMRHTSFALVEVVPELPEAAEIEVREDDVRVDVFRSSGPGGQSVNTTDSAVRLVHKPTGIVVVCQNERSQHQNKENAFKILKAKLFAREEEARRAEELALKGGAQKAEWGKQIRSYVMQPYQLVKDHRTEYETSDINAVLGGSLDGFVEAYLRMIRKDRDA